MKREEVRLFLLKAEMFFSPDLPIMFAHVWFQLVKNITEEIRKQTTSPFELPGSVSGFMRVRVRNTVGFIIRP